MDPLAQMTDLLRTVQQQQARGLDQSKDMEGRYDALATSYARLASSLEPLPASIDRLATSFETLAEALALCLEQATPTLPSNVIPWQPKHSGPAHG